MKRGWKTWGDCFRFYLDLGHDHGSAAERADRWEAQHSRKRERD